MGGSKRVCFYLQGLDFGFYRARLISESERQGLYHLSLRAMGGQDHVHATSDTPRAAQIRSVAAPRKREMLGVTDASAANNERPTRFHFPKLYKIGQPLRP